LVGPEEGSAVGNEVGLTVGSEDGKAVMVGMDVGDWVGMIVNDGELEGACEIVGDALGVYQQPHILD
jgi:hypothetical protein